jgi:hypothetical protein
MAESLADLNGSGGIRGCDRVCQGPLEWWPYCFIRNSLVYILNFLLVPFLDAVQMLLLNGVADVETIDKTLMIATGAPKGLSPFSMPWA